MDSRLASLCFVFLTAFAAGCASGADQGLPALPPAQEDEAVPAVIQDPAGPIPAPSLPPDLADPAGVPEAPEQEPGPALSYTLKTVAPDAPELIATFESASLLARLADKAPSSLTGLRRRLATDLDLAQKVLQHHGYYAGSVSGRIEDPAAEQARDEAAREAEQSAGQEKAEGPDPNASALAAPRADSGPGPENGGQGAEAPERKAYAAVVVFNPGVKYAVGRTRILVADQPEGLPLQQGRDKLPETLADLGLARGAPAETAAVLDAVDGVREAFRDRGYPFASLAGTRYTLDQHEKTLNAEVRVNAGLQVRMGKLEVKGASSVSLKYLEALQTWKEGQLWNQRLVEQYRDALRESGLFQSAELHPGQENDAKGRRPVVAELRSAPERTVGGALKYDSDFGPGVQGNWEHRNLTGRGDRLHVEMSVWQDLQRLSSAYRLPFFLRNDQDFIAGAALLHEDTDAYELRSGTASAGLERRFSRRWTGSLAGSVEGGALRDPDEPRRAYLMFGLPLSVSYKQTDKPMDPSRGFKAALSAGPYSGEFDGAFSALRARLDLQSYFPAAGGDKLVLAARASIGTVSGVSAGEVPASIRFYSGGGGSVRGYAYQSLGPRNDRRDPLGGASMSEAGLEVRWKFSEEWGVVTFLDGGMAYDGDVPGLGKDFRWGAGVGLRYYTAIGPLRLDLATPLNPREDDAPLQVYFSIGQSF
jgi:translocation and assembly module TamA